MITLKSEREIKLMHNAGKLLASIHKEIAKMIVPGITTSEIEQFVEKGYFQYGGVNIESMDGKGGEEMKTLELIFLTSEGKTVRLSLDAPKEPIDSEEVKDAMQTIV